MKKSFFSAGLLTTLLLMGCSSTPVLKSGEIEVPVHKELDLSASCFFDSVDKNDRVTVKSGNLDIQKLGTYTVTIAYGKEDYKLKVKVVDKEKPVLKWKKKRLVFKLDTRLDKVNAAIRDNAVITDNYDKQFQAFTGLKSIPKSEKEVVFDVQVKDSSGNVSEKNSLLVQFTSDGREKAGLKQEHASTEISSDTAKAEKKETKKEAKKKTEKKDNKESGKASESKGTESTNTEAKVQQPEQGQASSAVSGKQEGGGEVNNAKPEPDSPKEPAGNAEKKEPVYPPEKEKPIMTVNNFPSYLLGNSGRVFATYDEAYAWANEQVKLEGSPWYGYYMEIGQPFDGDYANAGDGTTPWTVEFFK